MPPCYHRPVREVDGRLALGVLLSIFDRRASHAPFGPDRADPGTLRPPGPIVGMNHQRPSGWQEPGYARALARAGLSHVPQVTLASCRPMSTMRSRRKVSSTRRWRHPERPESGLHTIPTPPSPSATRGMPWRIVDFLHALGIHTFAHERDDLLGTRCRGSKRRPASEMAPLPAHAGARPGRGAGDALPLVHADGVFASFRRWAAPGDEAVQRRRVFVFCIEP